ncbi:hypothetical protein GMC98_03095 [Ruminococcus bromii]|nr:hypothetical protein [Ruminococcus bromii]MTQ93771.1 hypothetical protein [Ruminococcus bromii]MTR78126.1 hypothetical protein [Ruminococcus bromii]MTR87931.1 hypothetical protein [Ruminococcus bromii]
MSVNGEEKIYNDLMNEVPSQTVSGDTKQSAAALAGAESTATGQADDYKSTYSGKLDDAISNYLTGRGFEYDPMQDKAYQQYRKEFAQNAAMARDTSRNTANQLSGGYNPTYADTVANEVYNERMGNISDAESTFRGLAQQDYQAKQEKNANVLNLYNTLEGTDYSRNRDTVGDYKNYLNLLASRYSTDRQADVNLDSANNDVYSTKLNGAVNNLSSARAADSQRYLYDTVSANQLAQNAQAERENAQKIEYERNKAAYTAYTKAQKAAEKAKAKAEKNKGKTENANAVFASMGVTKNDFKKGTGNKEDGALYKEGGAVNYTVYAQTYIDEKYREGYINDDERDYLYKKIGITSDGSKYNSELADSFATTMGLDKQKNKKFIRGSIIQGHNMGQLSAADVAYLSAKYGLSLDD